MTHELPVDPELRQLLQAVADDPRARLFRTEIPRPTRLVLTEVPHVSPQAAGLTSAERELLRVYREDVAKLLRDAAEWKIRQDPLGAAKASEYSTPTRRDHYADANELLASLESRADRMERLSSPSQVVSTARTGRSLLSSPSSTAHQLAGLSLRLVPHDAAWVHIGRSLVLEKNYGPAMRAYHDVVRRQQSPRIVASSMTCVGAAFGSMDRHLHAAQAHRAASILLQTDPNALLSWFGEAAVAQSMPLALESAERLETLSPEAPALHQWTIQLACRLRLSPPATSDLSMLKWKRELIDHVGPSAQRVLHELP